MNKSTERVSQPSSDRVLSLVFAYYENPKMLSYQLEHLAQLPAKLLSQIEIVVVDDASPEAPAVTVARDFQHLPLSVFRIAENRPWNQDAARNIGVAEAKAPNVMLTDVDHIVPADTLEALTSLNPGLDAVTFSRKAHFSDRRIPSHVNSYFMSKAAYWEVGGYDEDFWGWYGTDKMFRKRLQKHLGVVLREDLLLELVTRGSISDAKNTTFPRSPGLLQRLRFYFLRVAKRTLLVRSPTVLASRYYREHLKSGG